MTFDLLLAGGTVFNPATGINEKLDVGVTNGRAALTPYCV
jgi:predicted amidohydrolase